MSPRQTWTLCMHANCCTAKCNTLDALFQHVNDMVRRLSLHLGLSLVLLQAGTVTVKNSCSRNLHRLLSSISFISSLLQNLESSSSCTLHTAASNAYNGSMAQIHNFFVRTAVKTSMYTLPTRQGFLESIGETGQLLSM